MFVFFFKQKTADEMRISDWSSDVCSSDLGWVKELAAEARNRLWYNALSTLGQIGRLDWREDFAFLDRPAYGATGMDQYLGWLCAWRNDVLGEVIDRKSVV